MAAARKIARVEKISRKESKFFTHDDEFSGPIGYTGSTGSYGMSGPTGSFGLSGPTGNYMDSNYTAGNQTPSSKKVEVSIDEIQEKLNKINESLFSRTEHEMVKRYKEERKEAEVKKKKVVAKKRQDAFEITTLPLRLPYMAIRLIAKMAYAIFSFLKPKTNIKDKHVGSSYDKK